MKLTALTHKPASAQIDVEREPVPRVVVVRRVDPKRPTRVWSLLLPPTFHVGERNSR